MIRYLLYVNIIINLVIEDIIIIIIIDMGFDWLIFNLGILIFVGL